MWGGHDGRLLGSLSNACVAGWDCWIGLRGIDEMPSDVRKQAGC